jgi:hypothetical protein
MKISTPLFALALALPLALALRAPADQVAFRVAGSSLTKTFELKTEMSQDDMSIRMNGNDMSGMIGDIEMTMVSTQSVVVTDEYGELRDGRPARLVRNYDALTANTHTTTTASSPQVPSGEQDLPAKSELAGKKVVFQLGSDGDYAVRYPEGVDGDQELLADLWEDMDMRALLPAKEVSPDESWELDLDLFKHVLTPGGNLKLMPDLSAIDGMPSSMTGGGFNDMLGELKGKANATYVGSEEVDGAKVGLIKLSFKVDTARDMTEMITEMMERVPMEGMEMTVSSADSETSIEGEGELRWNLTLGHLHSLEINGTISMTSDVQFAVSVGGQEMTQDISTSMSGNFEQSAKVGAR